MSCTEMQPHSHGGFGLTSPTLLRHPAHCLFLLLWYTLSHTETHPAQGCVGVFCPCWRRVFDPPLSPLMGWSWFLQHGRRPLVVCWWSSLNTCRTSIRQNQENVCHYCVFHCFLAGPWVVRPPALIKGRRNHAQFCRFVWICRGIQIQLCRYYKFLKKTPAALLTSECTAGLQANILLLIKNASYVYFMMMRGNRITTKILFCIVLVVCVKNDCMVNNQSRLSTLVFLKVSRY